MVTLKHKSIFISRKLNENSPFKKQINNELVSIIDEPLINLTQIPFSYTPKTDWVFFTSKNSIKFFLNQNPVLDISTKFGVISKSSANFLTSLGKSADFVGSGVNLMQIAKDFRDVLKNDSVLFPQAMDSLRTIQKQLAFTNTTYNLYTYKTLIKTEINLPYTDVLIFTSPSNVVSYFRKYKIDSRQLVIAMGESTKYKISEFGIRNVVIPDSFDEEGLLNCLIRN